MPKMDVNLNYVDYQTNIIYLVSPDCVKSLKTPALQMGVSSITPNVSVKILGVNVLTCMNNSQQYATV